jgi:hypothetical protein
VSALTTIVLNLKIVNGFPLQPMRSWRKSEGPGETIFIRIPTKNITGSQRGAAKRMQTKSSVRFHNGDLHKSPRSISKFLFLREAITAQYFYQGCNKI